jgi:uncharacterized protein (TIGR03435 family)
MCRLGIPVLGSPHAALALCLVSSLVASYVGFARVARAQNSADPAFEVASIKPSGPISPAQARVLEMIASYSPRELLSVSGQRVEARGRTAAQLVAAAYLIPVREIVEPSWMSDARFDVEALIPSGQSRDKVSEMLRTLLEERLALKAHHEVRRMSGYILSVGKGGPKLTETGSPVPTNNPRDFVNRIKPGFNGTQMDHCDLASLTNYLAQNLGAPVEDQTGLQGHFAIVIQYRYSDWADDSARPAILQDALSDYGLHLAAGKVDAPVLVIDNISKTPTEN